MGLCISSGVEVFQKGIQVFVLYIPKCKERKRCGGGCGASCHIMDFFAVLGAWENGGEKFQRIHENLVVFVLIFRNCDRNINNNNNKHNKSFEGE